MPPFIKTRSRLRRQALKEINGYNKLDISPEELEELEKVVQQGLSWPLEQASNYVKTHAVLVDDKMIAVVYDKKRHCISGSLPFDYIKVIAKKYPKKREKLESYYKKYKEKDYDYS